MDAKRFRVQGSGHHRPVMVRLVLCQRVIPAQQVGRDHLTDSIERQRKPGIAERVFQEHADPLGHQQRQERQPTHKGRSEQPKRIQLEKHEVP